MTDADDLGRERALRRLGRVAAPSANDPRHVDEALLALMRHGDLSDDIADAIAHVARCPDCRARLVEGERSQREVVVMAIEAPRSNHPKLARAAEASNARLVERGDGRWTAVVDASRAGTLEHELVKGEPSVVSRLVATRPVNVPREDTPVRPPVASASDLPPYVAGTDAAEVQAWALIPKVQRRKVARSGASPGWALFAVAAVLGAMGIAYALAIR